MKRPILSGRYGLKVARSVRERLQKFSHPVRQVFLFGSCATDSPHAQSDIDVAIVADPFARSKVKEVVAFYGAIRDLDTRIELIVLHPSDIGDPYLTVAREIDRNGIAV